MKRLLTLLALIALGAAGMPQVARAQNAQKLCIDAAGLSSVVATTAACPLLNSQAFFVQLTSVRAPAPSTYAAKINPDGSIVSQDTYTDANGNTGNWLSEAVFYGTYTFTVKPSSCS